MNAISVPMVVAVSYVERLVRSFISFSSKICIDKMLGISDAYYCAGCTRLEKDRDGCPKIVNLGASRTDLFYERRRLGTSHSSMFEISATHFTFTIRFQKGIDGVFVHHRTSI